MSMSEPPPKTRRRRRKPPVSFTDTEPKAGGRPAYPIRKARVGDVPALLALVNNFASLNLMLPRGPQYLFENIRDFVVAEDPAAGRTPPVVACASLHVLWEDIGEIRAMAIHKDYQNRGIGHRLVAHLREDAARLGLKVLFTFTLAEDLFGKLGFARRGRDELPPKVWGECSRCPKYFECDEIGMFLDLAPPER